MIVLIERNFKREGCLALHLITETRFFFALEQTKTHHAWVLSNVCLVEQHSLYNWALSCMDKLLGFHYALLVADLILFCYERDFMMSLSDDK